MCLESEQLPTIETTGKAQTYTKQLRFLRLVRFFETDSLRNIKDMLSDLGCCENLKLFNVSEKLVSFTTYITTITDTVLFLHFRFHKLMPVLIDRVAKNCTETANQEQFVIKI